MPIKNHILEAAWGDPITYLTASDLASIRQGNNIVVVDGEPWIIQYCVLVDGEHVYVAEPQQM